MMCFLFLNTKFPIKGEVAVNLTRLYGIGRRRALYLCDLIGLMRGCHMKMIDKYKFALLISLIKRYYGFDVVLKRVKLNRLQRYLSVKSYKSLRMKHKLPVRGQGTHNNARTAKSRHVLNSLREDLRTV